MKLAVTIAYIVVALLLTVVVLFQKGKDPRASAVMGGSGETFFSKNKSSTREGVLEKLTALLAVIFVVLSVVISLGVVK